MQLRALSFALPLISVFFPSGMQSSLWVLWLWWVCYMTCLDLRRFINFVSTKHSYFRFPSPPASIRVLKPVHPAGPHSYSFSGLPSSLRHRATESRAKFALWPTCVEVTLSICGYLPNTVCRETCRSVWISWWESLRNRWTTIRAATILIPGMREGKGRKKPNGCLQAVSHMAVHGVAT